MTADKQDAFQKFINHHVMHHAGSVDSWNLPFIHINALECFRYDSVMLLVVVIFLLGVSLSVRRRHGESPRGFAALVELYVVFIRDHIVYANFGAKDGKSFVSFFCTLFIFILSANLFGLFPLFSTATGNISVTAALALIFMFLCVGATVKMRGFHGLFASFIPAGIPRAMVAPMILMEVISFISRVFALCVRLFANMLAGHMVIYSMLGMFFIFGWVALPGVLMAIIMYLFEVFMACLQAYIFCLLSAIFMNMMLNPEHG